MRAIPILAAACLTVVCSRRVLLPEDQTPTHPNSQAQWNNPFQQPSTKSRWYVQLICFLAKALAQQKSNGFAVTGPLHSSSSLCARNSKMSARLPLTLPEASLRASKTHMQSSGKTLPEYIQGMTLHEVTFWFPDFMEKLPVLELADPNALATSYAERKKVQVDDPEVQKDLAGAEIHPTSFLAARAVARMIFNLHASVQKNRRVPPSKQGEGLLVLELGCGTGLPSLVALRTGADVTSADRSPVSRFLVSETASKYPDGARLRHSVVDLDLFEVFERMENPLNIMKERMFMPNIVVANEVFNDDPRLATAVGRFMGAAAAQGAGVIACMEAGDKFLRPDNAKSWSNFFDAFNEAVRVFHKDPQGLTSAYIASLDHLVKEPVPDLVLQRTSFGNVPFARQDAEIFYLPMGSLTKKA